MDRWTLPLPPCSCLQGLTSWVEEVLTFRKWTQREFTMCYPHVLQGETRRHLLTHFDSYLSCFSCFLYYIVLQPQEAQQQLKDAEGAEAVKGQQSGNSFVAICSSLGTFSARQSCARLGISTVQPSSPDWTQAMETDGHLDFQAKEKTCKHESLSYHFSGRWQSKNTWEIDCTPHALCHSVVGEQLRKQP